jgi:hypothetical protein
MKLLLENEIRIPKISWSLGLSNVDSRSNLMKYLEFNKTEDMRIVGGALEADSINELYLGEHTKHLRLHNLVNVDCLGLYKTLPSSLETFELLCGDDRKITGNLETVLKCLSAYCPILRHLRLNLLMNVNLSSPSYHPLFINLLATRLPTLETLDLSFNEITPFLISSIADVIFSALESLQ